MIPSITGIRGALIAWLMLASVNYGRVHAEELEFAGRRKDGFSTVSRSRRPSLIQTTQLFPKRLDRTDVAAQLESVVSQARSILKSCDATTNDVVRVQLYLHPEMPLKVVKHQLAKAFPKSPPLSVVGTKLPDPAMRVALDVTAAGKVHRRVSRGDVTTSSAKSLAFISGQAARGKGDLHSATRETLAGLQRTLKHLNVSDRDVLQVKCFLTPIEKVDEVRKIISEIFGHAIPVSFVEWQSSLPIEIELIAAAKRPSDAEHQPVEYLTPPWMKPSAVFSRVTILNGYDRIFVGTLAEPGEEAAQQTERIFSQLKRNLAIWDSDFRHLAKATYYVSKPEASTALQRLRSRTYDPARPPAASKAMVSGCGIKLRYIAIDMIAAPKTKTTSPFPSH